MKRVISKKRFLKVAELLDHGELTFLTIAKLTGVRLEAVRIIADGNHFHQAGIAICSRQKFSLSGRRVKGQGRSGGEPYLPSLEEIAKVCEEIRSTWPADRLKAWTPPTVLTYGAVSQQSGRPPSENRKVKTTGRGW